MPSVLLSTCGSEAAEFCNSAREGAVMGAILGLLQDYLQVSGLQASLRPPAVPSAAVASIANRQRCALLLCVRSCVNSPKQPCVKQGVEICFHPQSERSRRLAEFLSEHLSPIAPGQVRLLPAPQLPDFCMAKCPAVQLRLGYRDHQEDAQWMLQCTGVIAHALAKAVTCWFGMACKSPFSHCEAVVRVPGGTLALRRTASPEAKLLRSLPNGAKVLLLHREGAWQYVEYEGACGYVMRKFLLLRRDSFQAV